MSKELTCEHSVGHSATTHGCDGCCAVIFTGPIVNRVIGEVLTMLTPKGSIGEFIMDNVPNPENALRNMRVLVKGGSLDDSMEW